MTDRRVPIHVAVLVGVSAGAYACTLAGVAALQSAADAQLIAQRLPAQLTAERARQAHDAIDRAAAGAAERYAALVDRYDQAGLEVAAVESSLDGLATRAASLTSSAAALRVTPVRLPRVSASVSGAVAAPPTTHATTRASGG